MESVYVKTITLAKLTETKKTRRNTDDNLNNSTNPAKKKLLLIKSFTTTGKYCKPVTCLTEFGTLLYSYFSINPELTT